MLQGKSKIFLIAIIGFALVIILLLTIFPENTSETTEEIEQESINLRISAPELSNAYYLNKTEAETKYSNKTLEVTGVIRLADPFVILLESGNEHVLVVSCDPKDIDQSILKNLREGQRIILEGRPELIGNIILIDCKIVSIG